METTQTNKIPKTKWTNKRKQIICQQFRASLVFVDVVFPTFFLLLHSFNGAMIMAQLMADRFVSTSRAAQADFAHPIREYIGRTRESYGWRAKKNTRRRWQQLGSHILRHKSRHFFLRVAVFFATHAIAMRRGSESAHIGTPTREIRMFGIETRNIQRWWAHPLNLNNLFFSGDTRSLSQQVNFAPTTDRLTERVQSTHCFRLIGSICQFALAHVERCKCGRCECSQIELQIMSCHVSPSLWRLSPFCVCRRQRSIGWQYCQFDFKTPGSCVIAFVPSLSLVVTFKFIERLTTHLPAVRSLVTFFLFGIFRNHVPTFNFFSCVQRPLHRSLSPHLCWFDKANCLIRLWFDSGLHLNSHRNRHALNSYFAMFSCIFQIGFDATSWIKKKIHSIDVVVCRRYGTGDATA